jgi:anti-anti-sigma factor
MAELENGDDDRRPNGALPLGAVEGTRDPSGALVVHLRGEIDISNADAIGTELERLLDDAGSTDGATIAFVVDLSQLGFMDSSGIAMLLHVAARAGSIVVRNPSEIVRRMIAATGLSAVLPPEESSEE